VDVARLVNRLHYEAAAALDDVATLPAKATYTFDPALSQSDSQASASTVRKTSTRTVVSSELGTFLAREVVRECLVCDTSIVQRSQQLRSTVPKGGRYGYDLITEVGTEHFLNGRSLSDIRSSSLPGVPLSSLWDIKHKFLFYLGAMHRMAAPALRQYFRDQEQATWLIDGTLEPGSPIFFGAREAHSGIMLDCRKIPSENVNDIAAFLRQLEADFGKPHSILHDLNANIATACDQALSTVPHHICHYHFLAVLGRMLYDTPQAQLTGRLRSLKLKTELREQRKNLTGTLQQYLLTGTAKLLLKDLLRGQLGEVRWADCLAREILLGLHFWLLDYAADGQRQGYPFDPYQLLLHRRILRTHGAVRRLIDCPASAARLPRGFRGFAGKLENYLQDPVVEQGATLYEAAESVFERARTTLRLEPDQVNPMHASYDLPVAELGKMDAEVAQLRHDLKAEGEALGPGTERDIRETTLTLLAKYQDRLMPPPVPEGRGQTTTVRTTSGMESVWCRSKHNQRRTHGRSKLTRDFISLPAEVMLVGNLQNPIYIDLVLGSLDRLADKLAEAGCSAGPFTTWRNEGRTEHIGRLPKKLLRIAGFNEQLVELSLSAM